jgi:hypothetical protein
MKYHWFFLALIVLLGALSAPVGGVGSGTGSNGGNTGDGGERSDGGLGGIIVTGDAEASALDENFVNSSDTEWSASRAAHDRFMLWSFGIIIFVFVVMLVRTGRFLVSEWRKMGEAYRCGIDIGNDEEYDEWLRQNP